MSALGTVGKMLQNSLSRGGAKRTKKNPAPELEKGTFDYISEPKSDYFSVGFAKTDVMPDDLDKTTYYVAGYKINNPAKGALDPMTASAIWIDDQSGRGGVVFVSIDHIGLTNYDVCIIRDLLADFKKETGCSVEYAIKHYGDRDLHRVSSLYEDGCSYLLLSLN